MNREKWYDEEIAPQLLVLAEKCQDNGMEFIAVVEYGEDDRAVTRAKSERSGLAMVMLSHLAKCGTNIDGFMIGIKRYCLENSIETDSSIYLSKF